MPYVITRSLQQAASRMPDATQAGKVVSRHAVATLAEARDYALTIVLRAERDHDDGRWAGKYSELDEAARTLSESGGTVGPLPDGTVLEVKPTLSWGGRPIGTAQWLREERGWTLPRGVDDDGAMAAYNAAQA